MYTRHVARECCQTTVTMKPAATAHMLQIKQKQVLAGQVGNGHLPLKSGSLPVDARRNFCSSFSASAVAWSEPSGRPDLELPRDMIACGLCSSQAKGLQNAHLQPAGHESLHPSSPLLPIVSLISRHAAYLCVNAVVTHLQV